MEILKTAKRVGIMGGAFDPIHYGHLAAAEHVRHALKLDFILFIPTGYPPHKGKITFNEHRYLMTLLATKDNPHFYVSRMEIESDEVSYTIETLKKLKKITTAELFFIIGADEAKLLPSWKDADLLPKYCNWTVVSRPNYHSDKALKIPSIDISGTNLRNMIKLKQPIKYLVPTQVENYIQDLGLYSEESENNPNIYENLHKAVWQRISKDKYKHTIGVVESAVLLASFYGINMQKAHIAALFHDYAKEYSEKEKWELCRNLGITPDRMQASFINIMHGQIAAKQVEEEFNIQDPDILNAIAYHTTGRTGMSDLEKIIKIADNIEPNREQYPKLESLRKLSETGLNAATHAAIEVDIEYTQMKGRVIHPWGYDALAYLK